MLCRLFSSSGEQGPLFVAVRRLLTAVACLVAEHGCWAVQALVAAAWCLSTCSSWALARRLNSCGTWASLCMWDLPRSGIEPVSPALAGRFFTTEPPGKPWEQVLMRMFQMLQPQHCNSCLNSSGSVPTSESPHGLLLCQQWLPADSYAAHPLASPGSYSHITSSRYYH